jgi:glycosyltransferase involved in cell wall biosynthesis
LVSVVIATFNQAHWLPKTVQSVLDQSVKDIEVIVVDDASTDGTRSLVRSFESRVTYVRHDINCASAGGGAGITRNSGYARAGGRYIAFLDGDDLWHPGFLEHCLSALARFPEAGLAAANGVRFESDSQDVGSGELLSARLVSGIGANETTLRGWYRECLGGSVIATPSQVLVPRHVMEQVGLFDSRPGSDYDLYLRVSMRWPVAVVNRPLVRYRIHDTSISGPPMRRKRVYRHLKVDVLDRHRAVAEPIYHDRIDSTVTGAIVALGLTGERRWASRQLLGRIVRQQGLPREIALGLARMWMPSWATRSVRSVQTWMKASAGRRKQSASAKS